MRRIVLLLVLTGCFAGVAAPANALVIGLGDQKTNLFNDQRFLELGIKHVRLVVAWDALRYGWQRKEVDTWMGLARSRGLHPLVIFARSRVERKRKYLPSVKQLRTEFRRFRKRYPYVKDFVPWNEPNICSSRTCNNAKRAAQFYNSFKKICPRKCSILAANVVDTENVVKWLRQFLRHANKPRLWGLHNYVDANTGKSTGTRRMLRTVKGSIWFTETGGVVKRWENNKDPNAPKRTRSFEVGLEPAAKATAHVFELAGVSRRIKRVYFYHWDGVYDTGWDSGFVGPDGSVRPALVTLREQLRNLWG